MTTNDFNRRTGQWPGMTKRADGMLEAIAKMFGTYVEWRHAKLLALSIGVGTGVGWLVSNMSAKGPQDIATAQKAYQNERTAADIGKVRTKLESEYAASKNKQNPQSMRSFI